MSSLSLQEMHPCQHEQEWFVWWELLCVVEAVVCGGSRCVWWNLLAVEGDVLEGFGFLRSCEV